jgi:hypothetical protein
MGLQGFAASQGMALNEASIAAPPVNRVSPLGGGLQVPLLEVRGAVFTVWRIRR